MARTTEQIREAKRLHMAQKRAADPEAVRTYQRRHHAQNRERNLKKMREYYQRRFFWGRAIKLRGEGRATAKDLAVQWRSQRGCCAYTGQKLDRTAQLDHKMPRHLGGSDDPDNLQWVTASVNYAKRDLTHEQFVVLCGSVMRWIGERIAAVELQETV